MDDRRRRLGAEGHSVFAERPDAIVLVDPLVPTDPLEAERFYAALDRDTGMPHQIDVVAGEDRKRVLIEAKDYERNVDLPIVRDFWAVVDDLKPDAAFIVTTAGFSDNTARYARAKDITLAVLRPPRDDPWQGLVRRIELKITATGQAGPPDVTWELHPDDHDKVDAADICHG